MELHKEDFSFTRNLNVFNCRLSLESIILNGSEHWGNKLKVVFNAKLY